MPWEIRLSAAAAADFEGILRWTNAQFGARQARAYAETLSSALQALTGGPTTVGVRKRDDIAPGILTLHVARDGRKARHVIVFRIATSANQRWVEVLRLLHDAMDLERHVPPGQARS